MRPTPEVQMIKPPNCRPETRSRVCVVVAFLAFIAVAPGLFAQHYPDYTPNPTPAPAAAAAAVSAPAPEPASTALSSNRFLFVVDISSSMRRHGRDILDVVQTILSSGASGQLHVGDTIGIWTFNDDVYTGGLPLQTWSMDGGSEIIQRVTEFLSQQKFRKTSHLDLAMVPVAKVVKMSDIITVFVISSGAGPIRGTPFDNDINNQYSLCLHDMGNQPMPLVTVLQGKRGRFVRYTVNALPWPVVIPALPTPLKIPQESSVPQAAAPVAAPDTADQNIAANAPTTSTPAPVEPQPAPVQPQHVVNPPPYPVTLQTPVPANPEPQPAFTPPPRIVTPQVPAPAPTVSATQLQVPMAAGMSAPAASAPPAMPAPVPVADAPATAPENTAPVAPPAVEVRPPTSSQLPLVPPRQPPLVEKTLPATIVMAQNTPPAAPVPPSPTSAPAPAPAPAAPTQTAPAAPAQPPPQTLVAQATALVKSFTGTHRSLLLIGGVTLLVVASGLILLMARRSRPPGRVSLISQTMDDRRP